MSVDDCRLQQLVSSLYSGKSDTRQRERLTSSGHLQLVTLDTKSGSVRVIDFSSLYDDERKGVKVSLEEGGQSSRFLIQKRSRNCLPFFLLTSEHESGHSGHMKKDLREMMR